MFKAYIFDLDGTLLDTLDDLRAAVNAALSAYGRPTRTREEVRAFVGDGIRLLIERALPDGKRDPLFEKIFSAFRAYYGAHCEDNTAPYAGITETLRAIKARGARLAIVSNKADFAVQKLTAAYFPGLIDAAAGENEQGGVRKKPAPDALLSVMRRLNVTAAETVYVGDSDVDIETAKNAGLPCVSVAWGFRTETFLRSCGAETVIRDPAELLSL